jgi:hypothetical protein
MTQPRPSFRVLAVVAVLGAAACGGDDADSIDAAPPDATPDAEVDASVDRCVLLCECTTEFCSTEMAACMTECAGLEVSVRECRIEHCGYAQTNPGFHCPHARGENTAGVPPECLSN